VHEAFYRWLRQGFPPLIAGNFTAIEVTDQELEPVVSGWTPDEISALLFWRYLVGKAPGSFQ
jgi:hypothetical protein